MIKIVDQGVVLAASAGSERSSLAFPNVCVLPSGRWICGMRAAPTKAGMKGQHSLLTWSDDEGQTWSEPASPFVPPAIDGKAGLFRSACLTSLGGNALLSALMWVDHSDPELPFFNEATEGLLDCRIFFARSEDGGQTWGEPWLMDSTPFHCPIAITGSVLVLPGGEWVCQFELNNYYYSTDPWHHEAILMFSKDEGKTWPEYAVSGSDAEHKIFYWDQRPSLLNDASMLDLFWTHHVTDGYLNIQGRSSEDGGRTWGEIWDTGVPGQPAPAVDLPGKGLLMPYVDRTAAPIINARLSTDGGRSFQTEGEALIYKFDAGTQTTDNDSTTEAWAEMEKFSVGLPHTAALSNGDVLVVYYAGPYSDRTDIHWARLRVES